VDALPTHHAGPLGDRLLADLLRELPRRLRDHGTAHVAVTASRGGGDQLARWRGLLGAHAFHIVLVELPHQPVRRSLAYVYGYAAARRARDASTLSAALERHVGWARSRGIRSFAPGYLHLARAGARPVAWRVPAARMDALSNELVTSLLALAERVSRRGWRNDLRRAPLDVASGLELHRVHAAGAPPRWEVRFDARDARRPAAVNDEIAALLRAAGRRPLERLGERVVGLTGRTLENVALELIRRGWLCGGGWEVRWGPTA
jgi:hypothetical protein